MADRPTLYVLCGLPFAGKSTLGRALATRLDIPCVAIDAINTERGVGLNAAPISPDEWMDTYAEAYRRLISYLRAGTSAIFDAVNFTRAQRDELRNIAEGCDAAVCLIYLAVPPELATMRWQHNRLSGARRDVSDDNYALVLDGFEPPTDDEETLVYDGSRPPDVWLAAHFPD